MTLWQAIVLGVVQGLTEFLPISSTAHLRIVPALLGWDDPGAAFTAVIQLGTLVAVLLYFSSDIVAMTKGILGGLRDGKPVGTPEAKMGWMVMVGTIPVVIFGLLFKKHIETTLRSLYVIAGAMLALAVVLMLAEWFVRWRQRQGHALREMKVLGWVDAIVVGCAQCVALIPGSSRSGCTITGGLFLGMTRETAARFSFLLSLPAVLAAGIFELIKARHELLATPEHVHDLFAATLVSFIVGYASIAFLLGYLKKHTTWVFIIYRLALGGALLALLANGKLRAF
jgi:undecaprenyl-diphosphatase